MGLQRVTLRLVVALRNDPAFLRLNQSCRNKKSNTCLLPAILRLGAVLVVSSSSCGSVDSCDAAIKNMRAALALANIIRR